MKSTFDCIVGLSEHTLGSEVALGCEARSLMYVGKYDIVNFADRLKSYKLSGYVIH